MTNASSPRGLTAVAACVAAIAIGASATDTSAAAASAGSPAGGATIQLVATAHNPAHSIRFEPNQGQTDSAARFIVRGAGPAAFLTATDAVFILTNQATPPQPGGGGSAGSPPAAKKGGAVVRMHLGNTTSNPRITEEDALPGTTNYLLGRERSKWVTSVPSYGQVTYHDVYPGIDLVYHSGADGNLEYDFVVSPGADAGAIDLEFQGADSVAAGANGGLAVSTASGELTWRAPHLLEDINGSTKTVAGGYTARPGNRVGFSVGSHDPSQTLVIDPVLTYSTYLGGASGLGNTANAIATDAAGDTYVAGQANSVVDFPTTAGSFQSNFPGTTAPPTYNAFITKLSPNGSSLIYSTYLGGTGSNIDFTGDRALGIAVASSGEAYVTGDTTSADFPVTSTAFQTTRQGQGGSDRNAFFTKLNAQGSALVYSTYLGGSGIGSTNGDQAVAVAVDPSGDALVAGSGSLNFPVTSNAYQPGCRSNCPTNTDGVSTGGSTVYSSAGAVFNSSDVGASVTGTNIPANTTVLSVQTPSKITLSQAATASGTNLTFTVLGFLRTRESAFLARLNPAASGSSSLAYSTLLSGGLGSGVSSMSMDSSGDAYLTGGTPSGDFPTTSGVYQQSCTTCDSYADGVVASNLTTLTSATANFTQGDVGTPIYGAHLSVNATVASVSNATTATLSTSAISAGSTGFTMPQRPNGGASFVAELNPALGQTGLVFSTFGVGGNGVAVDSSGATYVTGSTTSATFPTTAGAFDRVCHQTTNSPCGTNPTFTDGATTNGSTTLTSASAHFNPVTDDRQSISGTNIPFGATIARVVSATTAILSQAATATGAAVTFSINSRQTGSEGFAAKLSPGGTSLVYSTYLGGASAGTDNAIAVDGSGHAVVVGVSSAASTYPVKDQVASFAGLTDTFATVTDAVVTELSTSGAGLVFSTFIGGDSNDFANSVSFDSASAIHVAGGTTSSVFPTTPGAFQTTYGGSTGNRDGNAFVLELSPVSATLPVVTGVAASHGPLSGNTPVVITGHGFTGATTVAFGSTSAGAFTVNSDTNITTTSPPQAAPAAGTTLVDGITVTNGAGTSPDNPIDRFTYGLGQWSATGSMSLPRVGASATLLNNGKVLVAGGGDTLESTPDYATAEVYDPAAGSWIGTGSMAVARKFHTATLLSSGKVLVVGGDGGASSAEIYDPSATGCGTGITGCWTTAASMPTPREGHTATLLPSGKVLVAGGESGSFGVSELATAMEYDPTSNSWTSVGSLATARTLASATLLQNGKVLVAGGCCASTVPFTVLASSELFDPAATGCGAGIVGCWTSTGSLGQARMSHTATLLSSGKVLVTGGMNTGTGAAFTSMEEYDSSAGTWTLVGLMQHPRVGHDATLLPDGKVLLTGGRPSNFHFFGEQSAELVDASSPASTAAADLMLAPRGEDASGSLPGGPSFTATLLQNGEVLTTGASGDATAELYAELPPLPTITSVSPTSGSGSSAVPVTITGTRLSAVTSASFGTAKTFAITHDPTTPDTKMTVASPGTTNTAGGVVDITVTSPGGTSATSSADHFTFGSWGFLRVTTPSGGLPSQISLDGNYLDTWGTTWVHTDTGSHQVCFSDVQGWTTPACQSVTVNQGVTTTVNGAFTQRGFLQVQESPAGVDGTVSVDGNPMDDYGTFTDLPTGSHQVCWSAAVNFTPPSCQTVTVNAGTTTMVTGTYTSNPGAPGQTGTGLLRVTTNPPLASQISVDGIPRDTWGLSWLQLQAGSQMHTVCFRSVQGYTAPACSNVTITLGQTTTVQGTFVQRGFLQAMISPAGLDGVVSVDGVARDDYGMFTDVATGSHTVCWGAVSGKAAPACQNVNVTAGTNSIVTGTYQ